MKLNTYAEFLQMGKDGIEAIKAPFRIAKIKAQATIAIADLDAKKQQHEIRVRELVSAKEINFNALCDALDDAEIDERRQQQLQDVVSQLFPEAPAA